MIQQGQVFKLAAKGADGRPLWAYRVGSQRSVTLRPVFVDESAESVVSLEVAYAGDAVFATGRGWWDEIEGAVRSV